MLHVLIRLRVREIAEAKGLDRSKLSRMSDVDIKTIRRIFNHPETSITLVILDKLAKALHVDASQLIESVPDD